MQQTKSNENQNTIQAVSPKETATSNNSTTSENEFSKLHDIGNHPSNKRIEDICHPLSLILLLIHLGIIVLIVLIITGTIMYWGK